MVLVYKIKIQIDCFRHGVEILEPGAGSSSSTQHFRGTGYKLGQDATASEVVPGMQEPTPPQEVTLK